MVLHQATVDLSDDMSLKKHLLYLKAKGRQKKRVKHNTEQLQEQKAEQQMERLWCIEAKLWKLKQILSTIKKSANDELDDLSLNKQKVVYVPVAQLKEKD